MAASGGKYYEADTTVTYAVYGLIGGAWTLLGRQSVYLYGTYPNGGLKTLYGDDQITVSTSSQVDAIKVIREGDGNITGANASWTSQSSSSSRSATPNGQTVTATVRPN